MKVWLALKELFSEELSKDTMNAVYAWFYTKEKIDWR
jgi:hypothetical protein